MKKLIGLLGSFGLVAAAGITVVSCGDKDNNDVKDLSKVIVNQKDLTVDVSQFDGQIGSRDFYKSTENNVSIIVKAIKDANTDIDINENEIEVHGISSQGAKIVAKDGSTVYTGSVNVTFVAPKEQVDLSTIISNTTLEIDVTQLKGDVDSKGQYPSNNDNVSLIVKALKDANTDTDINENEIEVHGISTQGAKIVAKDTSKIYKGSVDVKFEGTTPSDQVDLSKLAPDAIGGGKVVTSEADATTAAIANVVAKATGLVAADLKEQAGSYVANTDAADGSIIIEAATAKATGSVKVVITKFTPDPVQVDISKLAPDAIGGGKVVTSEADATTAAIANVVAKATGLVAADLKEQAGSYVANTDAADGSIIIEPATAKATGSVKVVITKFTPDPVQVDISKLAPDAIGGGKVVTSEADATTAAIANVVAKATGLVAADLKEQAGSYVANTDAADGSIIIEPATAKATGSVKVVITKFTPDPVQVDISKLAPDAIGGGKVVTSEADATTAAIANVVAKATGLVAADLKEQAGSYVANTDAAEGSIIIEAATNKATGSVKVVITKFTPDPVQVDLSKLAPDAIGGGKVVTSEADATTAAIANVVAKATGLVAADLKEQAGSYVANTDAAEGSIIIEAATNKATGSVKVVINKFTPDPVQVDLSKLAPDAIGGGKVVTSEADATTAAIANVVAKATGLVAADLKEQAGSYVANTDAAEGSIIIEAATNKATGSVKVVINKFTPDPVQVDLSKLAPDAIGGGKVVTSEADATTAAITNVLAKATGLVAADLKEQAGSYVANTDAAEGSIIIEAATNKATGSVKVVINKFTPDPVQVDLSKLAPDAIGGGKVVTSEADATTAAITNVLAKATGLVAADLKEQAGSYVANTDAAEGSIIIEAATNKATGSVKVVITKFTA